MSGKAVLKCRQNSHTFQDRTLTLDQPVKIGRSVARDRTAVNNGIFDCKVLSRNHAIFWYTNGKFYIKDTKSSNGTFVNNQRLSKSGEESGPREVCSGDIVQFGVDVLENACKVAHGCIVATLKLFLPDGKEAKESPSTTLFNTTSTMPPEELYELNQCIQNALHREETLNTKLKSMKETIEFCRLAADKGWKALIAEDRLLSRVESLENQLEVYSQTYSEDKSRQELLELHGAKATFELILKDQFKKILDEKLKFHIKCSAAERTLLSAEMEILHLNSQIAENQEDLQVLAKKLCLEVAKVDELQHSLLQVQKTNEELQQRLKADRLDDTNEKVQGQTSKMYLVNEQNEKISHSSSSEHTMQVALQMLSVAIDEQKECKDNVEHIIAQINLLQTEKMSILLEITDKETELIQLSNKQSRCQKKTQTLNTAVIYFEEGLRRELRDSQKMEKFSTKSEVEIKTLDRSDMWDVIPEKWNADTLQTHVNKQKGPLEHAEEKCSISDMKMYKVKLDIGAATDKLKETTDNCMLQQKRLEEMQVLYEEKERAVLALIKQLEEKLERSSKDTTAQVRKQISEMYLENEQCKNIFFYSSSIEHMMQVAIQRLSVSIDENKKFKHIIEHVISHINVLQDEKMSRLQEIVDQEKEAAELWSDQSIFRHNIEFLNEKLIDFERLLNNAIWEAGETETCSPQSEVEITMVLDLREWHLVVAPGEWDRAQIQIHINKVKGSLEKERKTYMEKEIKIKTVKENISATATKLKETTHNCEIQEKRLEEVQVQFEKKEKTVLALKEQLNKYLEILSNLLKTESNQMEEQHLLKTESNQMEEQHLLKTESNQMEEQHLLKTESNQMEEQLKPSNEVTTERHCKQDGDICLYNATKKQMLSQVDIKQTVVKRLSLSIDEQKKCKCIVDHIIGTIKNLQDRKHSRLHEIHKKENEMADQPGATSRWIDHKRNLTKNTIDFEPLIKAEILECQKVDKYSPESDDINVEPDKWDLPNMQSNLNKSKDSLEHKNKFCTAGEMKVHELKNDIDLTYELKEITDECTIQRKRLEEAQKLLEWKERAVLDLMVELHFFETSLKEEANSNDTTEQLHMQLLEAQQLAKRKWNEAEQARDRVKALRAKLQEQSKKESEDKLKFKQFLTSQQNLVKLRDKLNAEESKIAELEYCNQRLTSELDEKNISGEHKLCLNGSQIEICALDEELILLKEKLSEIETCKYKLENELHTIRENIFSKNIVFVLLLVILIMAIIYVFFPTLIATTGTTSTSPSNY